MRLRPQKGNRVSVLQVRLGTATGARVVPGSQHPRTQPSGPSVLPTCLGAANPLRARDGSRSVTSQRIRAMVGVTRCASLHLRIQLMLSFFR
jgi:hypothetical protein